MADRIVINVPTYMVLDGQWQIVYPGSVVDVPSAASFTAVSTVIADAAGTLRSHGKPTPVRNVRTR
jgi:hypothetical protein